MVAIFSGYTSGLNLSSIATLDRRGVFGVAGQGRNGEAAYVNLASGNLVLQDQDLALAGLGLGTGAVRTYNSLGAFDFDGNLDAWQGAPTRAISRVDAGTLRRYEADGSVLDYVGSDAAGYVAKQAFGSAVDRITVNGDGTYTWTDGATGNTESYQAGAFGRITFSRDTSGNTLSYQYDASNLLTKVTNADGETVNFTYVGRNLQSVTTKKSDGTVLESIAYTYDAQNRLQTVSVTVGAGKTYVTTYAYEGTSNRLSSVTQTDGTSLGFTYVLVNGAYRIATVTDGAGKVTSFSYDLANNRTTVTDPLGVQTKYQYKATTGQLETVTAGITSATPNGQATFTYGYDLLGDVTTITDGLGRVTTMTYDGRGNLTTQVDGAGNRLERTYDARNQLLTETVYAAPGAAGTGVGAALPETTRSVYDAAGKNLLRFLVSAEGRVTEYRYNAVGQRIQAIEILTGTYDTSALGTTGVPTEAAMVAWAAGLPKTSVGLTELAYDFRGQLQAVTKWDLAQWNTTTQTWVGITTVTKTRTEFIRDQRGQLLQTLTVDLVGTKVSQTNYTYDGLGRVLTTVTTGPIGELLSNTITAYDDANGKTVVTLASGLVAAANDLATTSTYDRAGRLLSVAQASGATALGTTAYSYDAAGRLLMTTDPTGARSWILYDTLGRKVGEVNAARGLTEYVYDPDGQITQVIRYATPVAAGIALVDAGGKPTTELNLNAGAPAAVTLDNIRQVSPGSDEKAWRFYDAAGRLAWEVDALGYVTQTQYDGASRVLAVTRLATPIDTSALGNGVGVRYALAGLGTTTVLTETVTGSGPAALHQLTATVTGQPGATPTGTVVFFNGATILGSATVAGGVATLTTRLPVGANSLSAVYSGDASNVGGSSAAVTSTVGAPTPATVGLAVTGSGGLAGAPVTLVANVTGVDPNGTITFWDGATSLGTAALVNGAATLTTTTLTAGQHLVSASYGGDALNGGGTSVASWVYVLQPTSLTVAMTRASASAPVVLTATMGAPAATGLVTFMQGTVALGTASIVGGVATLSLPSLLGVSVKAVYAGGNVYATATSLDVAVATQLATSTIALSASATQVTTGQNLSLTATVTSPAGPTGLVTFYNGATVLGTAALNASGQATLTVNSLVVGSASVTASYAGDTRSTAVVSAATAVTVSKQQTSVTLVSSAPTAALGTPVTLTAVVGTGTYAATGVVTFFNGTTALGTAAVVGGSATLTLANLALGSASLRASYSGDAKATTGVSAVLTQNIAKATPVVTLTTSVPTSAQGTAVALTALVAGAPGTPATGSVTFYNGATALGTVALANGAAVLSLATLPAGALSLTASYAGDTNNLAATSAAASELIRAPMTLTSSVATVQQGTAFTLTATVKASSPPGYVTFYNGQTVLGVVQVVTGPWTATLTTAIYGTGTANIRAAYTGDYTYSGAQSATVAVSVTAKSPVPTPPAAPPATTVTLSGGGTAALGSWLGLQGVVTVQAGRPVATGTVSFYAGTTLLGCATLGGGTANFNLDTGTLALGTYAVTAVYSGDANGASSTSAAGSITIDRAVNTVTLRPTTNAVAVGGSVTLVAQVAGNLPSGNVEFYNGAALLGAGAIANGLASLAVTTLPAGTATITARYVGDTRNAGATSAAATVVVTAAKAATTITLTGTAWPTYVQKGLPITLTATVTGSAPTGTVTFFNGTTMIGSAALSGATAQLVVSNLPLNVSNITAVYSGDAANATKVSANLTQGVSAATTTTTLTSSLAQSTYGQVVTLTARVTGTGSPTGSITFKNGATVLGTVAMSNGQASLSISSLPVGSTSLTAVYVNDADNLPSTSAAVVTNVGKGAATVTLTGVPGTTIVQNSPMTLTARVTASLLYVPTGTVTFFRGTTVLGTATLVAGSASLFVQGISVGTEDISVAYAGDATVTSAVAAVPLTATVGQASMTLAASATSVAQGAPIRLTAFVSGLAPTGTVTFFNGDVAVGGPIAVANGVAACTVSSLPPGLNTLRATYSGDAGNGGCGTVAPVAVTVIPPVTVTTVAGRLAYTGGFDIGLSSRVTGVAPGGFIAYLDGKKVLAVVRVSSDGTAVACVKVTTLPTGPITTAYSGDSGNISATCDTAIGATQISGIPSGVYVAAPTVATTLAVAGAPVVGSPVTLTATVASTAGGMVTFFRGSTVIGSAPTVDGRAVLTYVIPDTGTNAFQAVYGSTSSTSGVLASYNLAAATRAVTTTTVHVDTTSTVAGASFRLVARVTGANPTGTITFKNGAVVLNAAPVTLVDGVATYTVPAGFAAGVASITATYAPADSANAASTSAVVQVSASAIKTAAGATVSVSPATSTIGAAVTISALVTGTTPTGTVTFFNGATLLGSAVVVGGSASLALSSLPVGTYSVRAVYSGDASNKSAVSATAPATVQRVAPTTTLTASTATSSYGAAVVLTATVGGAARSPTGVVTFKNGAAVLGTGAVVNGVATLSTTSLAVGAWALTAEYGGDANNASAVSAAVTETVTRRATVMTRTSGDPMSANGTLTISVAGTSPTGTVSLFSGSTLLASAQMLTSGTALFSLSSLPVGTTALRAVYLGDTNNDGTSFQFNQTVVAASSTTTLTATATGTVAQGGAVRLTARVTGAQPTGTVTFFAGATNLGTATMAGGVASLSTTALPRGSSTLTAQYSGDARNTSGYSAPVTETVLAAPAAVTVSASAATVAQGSTVTFTATVVGSAPTGQVTFLAGATVLGVASITAGTATLTVSALNLPVGARSVVAEYGGDATNGAARSSGLTETVTAGTVTARAASSAQDRVTTRLLARDGLLAATVDGEGYLTEYLYDAGRRLVGTVAYATRISGFSSAASIAAAVATARSTYSLAGLRPGIDGVNDVKTFIAYDGQGRKVRELDGEKYLTEWTYDTAGLVSKVKRYLTPVASAVASSADLLAVVPTTSTGDQQQIFLYDGLGRVTKEVNAEGTYTSYYYDKVGNLLSKTVAGGTTDQRNYLTTPDAQGRVVTESVYGGGDIRHTYDAAGRRTSTTDAAGNRTLFFYDEAGRLRYSVNALGEVTRTDFDGIGRVTATSRLAGRVSPAAWQGGLLSANAAAATALEGASLADSTTVRRTYDGDGRVIVETMDGTLRRATTQYDAFGGAVKVTQAIDATQSTSTTSIYDRRGLRTDSFADAGGVNARTQVKYDAFGRAWQVTGPTGLVQTMSFDRLGRTIQVSDFTGARRTTYDAFSRVLRDLAPVDVARLTGVQANDDAVWATYATQYTYDRLTRADGVVRRMTVRTPEGVVVETLYNLVGQTWKVTDGNGTVSEYAYGADGALLTRTRTGADGSVTVEHSSYRGTSGLLEDTWTTVGLSATKQNLVRYGYDAANRVVTRQVDPDGPNALNLTTRYAFDAKGQQITETSPSNLVTTTTYDQAGDVMTRVVDAVPGGLNLTTVYTHDARGQVLTVEGPGGRTSYRYDGLGRRTDTIVNADGVPLTTTYQYDAGGNVVASWDANRNLTRSAFDAAGRLVYTVDAMGGVVKNDYDANGRVIATTTYAQPLTAAGLAGLATAPSVAAVAAALSARGAPAAGIGPDAIQRSVYDKDGRLRFTVDGKGGVTRLTYDKNGNVVERRSFAATIDLAAWNKVSDPPVVAGTADVRTRIVYDALDRAIYTVDGTGALVAQRYDDAGNLVDRVAYANRLATVSDAPQLARGDITVPAASPADTHIRRIYDAAGRLTWSVDGVGAVTRQDFDRAGNLVKVTQFATTIAATASPDSAVASGLDRVTVMGYDAANRRTIQVDATGSVSRIEYDAAGNVVRKTAYATRLAAPPTATSTVSAVLSAAAAVTTAIPPVVEDRVTRAVFDGANRMVYAIDATGAVLKYDYDAAGNVIATTAYATRLDAGRLAAISLTARPADVQVTATAADRTTLSVYDAAGRMAFTVDALGYVAKTEYDGAGRVIRTLKDGISRPTLTLGVSAATIQSSLNVASNTVRSAAFTYDAAGNTLSVADALGISEYYEYNGVGSKTTFTNRLGNIWTYTYDAAGRLLTEKSPQVTQRLADDGTVLTGPAVVLAPAVVTALAYDALGNLVKRTEGATMDGAGVVSGGRFTEYRYDAVGHQTETWLPAVSVYDAATDRSSGALLTAGAIARVESAPVVLKVFTTYDAFGDAVASKDVSGNWSYKVYDRAGRLEYDIDAEAYVTRQTRNAFGDVLTMTRFATRRTGLIAVAGTPPTAAQLAPVTIPGPNDRTLTTDYDKLGRATTVTQPAVWGNGTTWASNTDWINGVDWQNNPTAWSGEVSPVTATTYNAFGEVIQVSQRVTDSQWNTTTHYYDRLGRRTDTVDALGYRTRMQYDAVGNLTQELQYARAQAGWDPASFATASLTGNESDPDNRKVTYTYDQNGRKKTETRWNVEYSTDATGTSTLGAVTTELDYDRLGNLVWTRDPMGAETRTYYDALGRIEAVVEPSRAIMGATPTAPQIAVAPITVFLRDAYGNVVVKAELAAGAATATALGWTAVSDLAKDRVTKTTFDARGNAIKTTEAFDAADTYHQTKYMSYDEAGRIAKMWQGVDWITATSVFRRTQFRVFKYDKLGNQVEVISPASTQNYDAATGAFGTTLLTQSAAGTVSECATYNAFGEVEEKYKVKTGEFTLDKETFEYDRAGRLWRTNSGDGNFKVYLYDLAGRQTATIVSSGATATRLVNGMFGPYWETYGNLGDRSAFVDARSVDQWTAPTRRTENVVDLLGRVLKTTLPARQDAPDPSVYRPFVLQTYDRWGNVVTQSDARNKAWITTFRYNANNQLVEQVQPDGDGKLGAGSPITRFYFDKVGRQVAIRDANGNVNGQVWDKAGQLIEEIHADGGHVLRRYDAFGNQVAVQTPVQTGIGYWTTYAFDRLGRNIRVETEPVQVWNADWANWGAISSVTRALVTTFAYDELDNKILENNDTAPDKIFGYDLQGNLVTSSNGRDRRLTAYDIRGNRIGERDALGLVERWTYDAFGRLTKHVQDYDLWYYDISTAPWTLKKQLVVGGRATNYNYDLAGQLVYTTISEGLYQVQTLTYAYDAAGQLTSIVDSSLGQRSTFAYNAAGKKTLERVEQAAHYDPALGYNVWSDVTYQDQWLAYDTLGRLAQVNALDGTSVHYDYDKVGNRLHQSVRYNTAAKSGATYVVTAKNQDLWYAYDAMNRAILVDGALNGNATDVANITAAQGHIVEYYQDGNRKSDKTWGTDVTAWAVDNWVNSYGQTDKAVVIQYGYDAAGRLEKTTRAYQVESDTWDPDLQAYVHSSSTATAVVDVRNYDGASRVVRSGAIGAPGQEIVDLLGRFDDSKVGKRVSLSDYDADGNLIAQRSTDLGGGAASDVSYQTAHAAAGEPIVKIVYNKVTGEWEERTVPGPTTTYYTPNYDAAGNLLKFANLSGGVTTTTTNSYDALGGQRLAKSSAELSNNLGNFGVMSNVYDANGFLVGVAATTETSAGSVTKNPVKSRWMVNDANGKVLFRNQNGELMRQLVVDGNVLGVYGVGPNPKKPSDPALVTQGNFDLNYQPITSTFPSAAAGQHQVDSGDTLQAIAQSAYGDSSLWYVIADANGLRGDGDLRVGATLTIPTRAAGAANKSDTYGAYDPSKIVGDTSPEAPAPPPPKAKCSGAGRIWATVLVVVVAVVVSVVTAGAAAAVLAPLAAMGPLGAVAAGAIAGAVAAAASSVASQLVSWGVGLTDGFSWKAVGMAALQGAVSGAVGAGTNALFGDAVKNLSGPSLWGVNAAKAMVASAITQQAQAVIWKNHQNFSWGAVANAGLSAALGSAMGEGEQDLDGSGWTGEVQHVAYKTVTGFQTNMMMAVIRGGEIEPAMVLADSFGNALGSSLGDLVTGTDAYKRMTSELSKVFAPPPEPVKSESGFTSSPGDGTPPSLALPDGPAKSESGPGIDEQLGGSSTVTSEGAAPRMVKAGDYGGSLERIARSELRQRLGRSPTQDELTNYVGQLFELNDYPDPRAISPDARIRLPDQETPAASGGKQAYLQDISVGEDQKKWIGPSEKTLSHLSLLDEPLRMPALEQDSPLTRALALKDRLERMSPSERVDFDRALQMEELAERRRIYDAKQVGADQPAWRPLEGIEIEDMRRADRIWRVNERALNAISAIRSGGPMTGVTALFTSDPLTLAAASFGDAALGGLGAGLPGKDPSASQGLVLRLDASRLAYEANRPGSPEALEVGRLREPGVIKRIGSTGKVEFQPTKEMTESAAFKIMVGEVKLSPKTNQPVGTIFDGANSNGLFELKLGDSPLESSYQLRLQTYASQVVLKQPLTVFSERPLTPSLQAYYARWGVTVQPPPKK